MTYFDAAPKEIRFQYYELPEAERLLLRDPMDTSDLALFTRYIEAGNKVGDRDRVYPRAMIELNDDDCTEDAHCLLCTPWSKVLQKTMESFREDALRSHRVVHDWSADPTGSSRSRPSS